MSDRQKLHLNWPAEGTRILATLPLVESDGADLFLTLIRADGSRLSIILGPAEAVAIAGELIQAARRRMGRAEWPQGKVP